MTSSRPSEQNRNSCHLSESSDGDSDPAQRSHLTSGLGINRDNKNVGLGGASCLARQPGQFQNRPSHAVAVRQPPPEKQNQIRSPVTKNPQVSPAARMASPANLQAARHGLQHQKLPQLAQQKQQQQHNVQHKQQQRPASHDQAVTAAANPGKRMDAVRFNRTSMQSPPSHQQNLEQPSPNKICESGSTSNKTQQAQSPSRVNFLQNTPRPLPPQSQFKVFSVPQHQGPHPQRQKPGDKMPQRYPPEWDDEGMDDDDDEEDGAYNEAIDEEEMQYSRFPNSFGYDFNSSDDNDDDELSEEESALLEELRFCDDDERYNDIIERLHEKGIDPEEIEELLYHSSNPPEMFSNEGFPSGDEDEAEGTVSSSSQSQLPQIRHHPRGLPAQGHPQPGPSLMSSPQAAGFKKNQAGPSSIPATANLGRGQQRMIPRQLPHQVSGASGHPSSQGQPVQYQQRQWGQKQRFDPKLAGQPKKIFQNSPSQSAPGTPQGNARQKQVTKMAPHLHMEDSNSSGEDIPHVRQAENIDDVNTPQAQLQTEGGRLQIGRQITNTSGPQKAATAGNKADENQTSFRPLQQRDIGQKSSDEQGAFVGQSLAQPTGVRGQLHKLLPQAQVKSAGPPGMGIRAQLQEAIRPAKSVSRSGEIGQKLLPDPQLKAALEKNTAPSEAKLARLNVEYMQQSLDQEIKAKKSVHPAPGHLSGHKNLNIRHPHQQNRHPSPLHMKKHPPGSLPQTSNLHNKQTSPAGLPKHQLPPRQPIPAIINPNSNINTSSSTGKPVCSVVPFTLESQGQTSSKNVPSANSAPKSETFIRPQNPASIQSQEPATSPSQSPGVLQNKPKASTMQNPAPLAAVSPSKTLNQSTQGKTTTLSSNQISILSQSQPTQVHPVQAPAQTVVQHTPTQTPQTPTQSSQTHTQGPQTPTQAQQNHPQVQQTPPQSRPVQANPAQASAQQAPIHIQQTLPQTKPAQAQSLTQQMPTQVQQTPTHVQQTPTQIQQTPTHVQVQQAPTQTKPAQSQSQPQQTPTQVLQTPTHVKLAQAQSQAHQTPTQTQQTLSQNQQTPTQNQQTSKQNQQTPIQTQQTPTPTQQTPTPTQQTPTQTQQTPTQTQQTPTQTQQTPTQTQQTPTQTQQTPTQTQQTLKQMEPTPSQARSAQPQQSPTPSKPAQVPNSPEEPVQATATQPTTQTQAQTSKTDSFSVDRLSKEKCVITGKGKNQTLVVNMVYQIRSPIDGSFVLALWNGEKFEHLKQSGLSTPSGTSPGKKTRPEAHKVRAGEAASGGVSNQATYVKPLAPGHAQHRQEQGLDNCDDDDEDGEDNDDDAVFKKPFVEQPKEDCCRVCPFCGHTSMNLKRCESCSRIFRGDVKIVHINRQSARSSSALASSVSRSEGSREPQAVESVPRENLGKVAAVSRVRDGAPRDASVPSVGQGGPDGLKGSFLTEGISKRKFKDDCDVDSDEESAAYAERHHENLEGNRCGLEKRPAPGNSKEVVSRKRLRRHDDTVTVTISSDEDEPSSTSSNLSSHALSPTGHAGRPPSFLFPQPRPPAKQLGKLREEPAQDEERGSTVGRTGPPHPLPMYMYRPGEAEEDDEDEDDGEMDGDDDGEEPAMYEIDIRSVRVGSMRTQPEGPLLISLEGVCIKVRSERTEEVFDFEILAHEVEKVKYFLGEIQPVLYLFVTQDCGEKLRCICHMEAGDEEFFDPSSSDMKQKMIVVIIEGFSYMSQGMLRETLSLWADLNQVDDENFIEELTDEESNDLLIQSAPPVLTMDIDKDLGRFKQRDMKKMAFSSSTFPSSSDNNDNEPDSTSSSPPEVRCHYYGSSIRLLQYPPPPAKRLSITTEDLYCLTEGEFLNDVIIDFYLQYLYLEKLSEENRRRTHIFSSFFYKRLMQKDRHDRSEEDAKKSLPERRHARVKKWTKTVDLFSKDFIVIPINENSHWYLAVICFPGLSGPEAVHYIPSPDHTEDLNEETSDLPAEERSSQSSAYRTILGHQLDSSESLDFKESKPLVGQKQPCILMFDSLAGPSRIPNVRILREYLQCEWNAKKSEPRQITKILRSCTPDVPQQSNFSDCGVYLLQYVESFFEDPIGDFEIPMEGLDHWFPEEVVVNKRREIHELIMGLHRQYQMERGDPNILYLPFESAPREPPNRFYPDYDMPGHEEEMNYEPHQDGMSRMDDDMNYDPNYEMAAGPDEDMNYDPNYEMAEGPDADVNYETNGDHENSNSGLSEEANGGEDAAAGAAVENNG
ncbi:hypothetical protein BsWGS_27915 [Bradybaena similaris]